MGKVIYKFGGKSPADGDTSMRPLLGGKGANLAEMTNLGISVPPGFTIPATECIKYYNNDCKLSDDLKAEVKNAIEFLEDQMNKKFGSSNFDKSPLLLSIRSGSQASMPGMMDTILNLGVNDEVIDVLKKRSGNERFAYDTYRRFLQMYGSVVLAIPHSKFENIIEKRKEDLSIYDDVDLRSEDMIHIMKEYVRLIQENRKDINLFDIYQQLFSSIEAVFKSWYNDRAKIYRRINNIPEEWGTAVNVQSMVFGNMGDSCATGVVFTRNPSTGEKMLYGEYLPNAQGEDVVAGIRTPYPIISQSQGYTADAENSLDKTMPKVFLQLESTCVVLEKHYKDLQDIEFTIEDNKLWLLQTRSGKRTASAAVKVAVDMVKEGVISKEEAILRIDPNSLDQILHPTIKLNKNNIVITKGLPASPGAAIGRVVFSTKAAELATSQGKKVILLRSETSPEDINGIHLSEGILTLRGGMTSHAAVVARGMGKCCITGAVNIKLNEKAKLCTVGDYIINEGDIISINGTKGEVILGEATMQLPELPSYFEELIEWSNQIRVVKVRANAETLEDTKTAIKFHAEGIGLCRTEHMFFDPQRILFVREMILADSKEERQKALDSLLQYQKDDFFSLFKLIDGRPINIRLLDPPLHEFLPEKEQDFKALSEITKLSIEEIKIRADKLKESNPMLGHRGCRLGISNPEIYQMQVTAILLSAAKAIKENQCKVNIEIMIPFVFSKEEIVILKNIISNTLKEVEDQHMCKIPLSVGTMIELPRAALLADEIAPIVDYFSFGTNDLTQTTMGISRDDSMQFIEDYINNGILTTDPFVRLDEKGVGKLIDIASQQGRKANPTIKLGICGEHGGNPDSLTFFADRKFDYVSCSPFRIPIAQVALAKHEVELKRNRGDDCKQ